MLCSHRLRAATCAALAAVLLHAGGAHAQGTTERYSLRGFGGWNLGNTNNQNTYAYVASGDTEYNNYNFALNLAAQPSDKLTVRAQAFWGEDLRGRRIDLDYVFAQFAASPKLKVRVGKVLSPFGLYTEIYDVGTLRPFYLLPQFYSGVSGLLPKSYLGGGVTGVLPLGGEWEAEYDAFGGEVRFQGIPTQVPVGVDPATGLPITTTVDLQLIGRPMVGGRLGVGSPSHGLKLGMAAMHADMEQSVNGGPRGPYPVSEAADLVNAYLQWERGPFTLRSEFFKAFADAADLRSVYVEASYKLTRHLQVAGLYEYTHLDPDRGGMFAALPEQLKKHESVGLGLNLWATPDVVFKVNGYSVHGNLAAQSANTAIDAAMGLLDDSTLVLVVGAQFSF
jgi:hypothetical protein